MKQLSEQEIIRRNKLKDNNAIGIQSYLKKQPVSHSVAALQAQFGPLTKAEAEQHQHEVTTYGRILAKRGPFSEIRQGEASCQVYVNNKMDSALFNFIAKLDLADIIWVKGTIMKTMTNEVAIRATEVKLMAKALKVLPEKYHGLTDVEERYRHRYVDLIVNANVRQTFRMRTKIISEIRHFFDTKDYLEVDTPILQPVLGGASARPFCTHHNALNQPFYLRIATELPLKKLLVGGFERVYEIGRIFRNEGIDTTHNPEFTSIEFYEANADLTDMMNHTEALIQHLARVLGKQHIEYQGVKLDLNQPFQRINICDAVSQAVGFDVRSASFAALKDAAAKTQEKVEPYYQSGHLINLLFEAHVEKTLIQPTFVYGHPVEISPLAAKSEADPRFTERAELFINTKEYANMFTELNDPIDQLERFEAQLKERQAGNDEANEIDYDFVEALEYGMPPAGGCGIGIDRLVMLLTNNTSIREVLLFPHLKDKH